MTSEYPVEWDVLRLPSEYLPKANDSTQVNFKSQKEHQEARDVRHLPSNDSTRVNLKLQKEHQKAGKVRHFPSNDSTRVSFKSQKENQEAGDNRPRKRQRRESSSSSSGDPQIQRAQANNRERQRTQQLNSFFSDLRRKVPSLPSDKLSKIQTLRFAMDYIQFLNHVLTHGLELMSGDVPESWSSSTYLTHELLSREFLFRRMQNAWASQRHPS